MRIAAANYHSGLQPLHTDQPQYRNHPHGYIVRIADAHGHENFATDGSNFPFPLAPSLELAAQHGMATTKEKPCVRLTVPDKSSGRHARFG